MTRIRILPELLANQIAAGEVVERPASVVKELVENALDAGGTRIAVEIENGGRNMIRVADNGGGMSPDDALLALERFATSKIGDENDLFAIRTLGFRGEALPSIAAVSKLILITRTPEAPAGVEVRVEGGKIMQVKEAGAPAGTLIEVAQLFFNTPARRKFLKAVNTEMGHIAEVVAGMALGHPGAHFKLSHNDKTVGQWLRGDDAAGRAAQVLGLERRDLYALESRAGDLELGGWLGASRQSRATTRGLYLYVNGRRVRDRVIQHALLEGYAGRLMKGQFPAAVLFLKIPCDQVDVNVHPTKHEIRFLHAQRIHQMVSSAVAAALARSEQELWSTPVPSSIPATKTEAVAQAPFEYLKPLDNVASKRWPAQGRPILRGGETRNYQIGSAADTDAVQGFLAGPSQEQQPLWSARRFTDLTIIGQFSGTYIVCQAGDDLVLVDQHAAHERIVFEALQQSAHRVESQRLLVPESVELGYVEAEALERLIPRLADMGLEIEPFGGNTFLVKSLPTLLDQLAAAKLLRELAERAVESGTDTQLEPLLDQCRMVMACHGAVRANQRLAAEEMRHLLKRLESCLNSSHCPHGRPTYVRWSSSALAKAFGRLP